MKYSRTINERRGIIGFVVPMNVGRALESGKVLVNATFGKNGAEFWVQFLDPEFSHKTMGLTEAEEFISSGSTHTPNDPRAVVGGRVPTAIDGDEIDDTVIGRIRANVGKNHMKKVVLPASWEEDSSESDSGVATTRVASTLDKLSLAPQESKSLDGPSTLVRVPTASEELQAKAVAVSLTEAGHPFASKMTPAEAASRVKAGNLDRNRKQGLLNIFPSRSLVKEDFKKTILEQFQARTVCVAEAVGAAKMISRIACDQRMKIPGCSNLSEWWLAANEEQRFLAVTEAKSCNGAVDKRRLLLLPCPFQDAGLD